MMIKMQALKGAFAPLLHRILAPITNPVLLYLILGLGQGQSQTLFSDAVHAPCASRTGLKDPGQSEWTLSAKPVRST